MKELYYKETLENGIRVVMEEIPHVRSVSVGIWIDSGSKDETPQDNGVSHFIEHMMFKGTHSRTSKEIAEAMEGIGGEIGAFTSREHTCFYAKVADKYLPLTIEVLADMFFNSIFHEKEVEREKGVIREEIKMYEDTPDDLIHDLFIQTIWENHAIGKPIIGKRETVNSLNREKLLNFKESHHTPDQLVISVAGNIKPKEVIKQIKEYFSTNFGKNPHPSNEEVPKIHPHKVVKEKELEQVHLCLGTKGLNYTNKNRFALYILDTILGRGMSSRLFQEIREKRGLAYSVHSYHNSYRPAGLFTVYLGTSREKYKEAIEIILKEFTKLKNVEVPSKELSKAKEQLKGNLILSSENTSNRMTRIAKMELYFRRLFTLDEILSFIDEVTASHVLQLARDIFQNKYLTITSIGPITQEDFNRVKLEC